VHVPLRMKGARRTLRVGQLQTLLLAPVAANCGKRKGARGTLRVGHLQILLQRRKQEEFESVRASFECFMSTCMSRQTSHRTLLGTIASAPPPRSRLWTVRRSPCVAHRPRSHASHADAASRAELCAPPRPKRRSAARRWPGE
jgi:hypothetical protein